MDSRSATGRIGVEVRVVNGRRTVVRLLASSHDAELRTTHEQGFADPAAARGELRSWAQAAARSLVAHLVGHAEVIRANLLPPPDPLATRARAAPDPPRAVRWPRQPRPVCLPIAVGGAQRQRQGGCGASRTLLLVRA